MNEKSLIYSLFSKFLDEGQDEIPREEDGKESPEREQDKSTRRRQLDTMLYGMSEKDLKILSATAKGIEEANNETTRE